MPRAAAQGLRWSIVISIALAACSSGDSSPPSPPHRDESPPARISDTDGDGLTDFAELHKYGTNPRIRDVSERYAHSYSIVNTIDGTEVRSIAYFPRASQKGTR